MNTSFMQSTIVKINLSSSKYNIYINNSIFDFKPVQHLLKNRKIAIISNETVAPIYLQQLTQELGNYNQQVSNLILPDGEEYKNLTNWNKILDFLAENKFNRSDLLMSLGGGVICDMTGFAAASWMRGIDFVQVPTSLLAQVDASVGGKTGINHPQGKNLIGAFHQPKAVIINTSTLKTLPDKEFKSGLGETIKYALINQPEFMSWLKNNSESIITQNLELLTEMISQCCHFKADIVQQDEKELGVRALLNLGHTFAHAIETHTSYIDYTHGEAVAIGIAMAAELSAIMKKADDSMTCKVNNLLQQFNLQTKLPMDINAENLVELMRLDKKVQDNSHRLVLMKDIGKAYIQENVCEKDIIQAIKKCQN